MTIINSALDSLIDCYLISTKWRPEKRVNTVVYVCQHNSEGCIGFSLNEEAELTMDDLLGQISIRPMRADATSLPVLNGGPEAQHRGFVLHEPFGYDGESAFQSTSKISGEVQLTTSKDILDLIATGAGPKNFKICVGCYSWAPGMVEAEIAENQWIVIPARNQFDWRLPTQEIYRHALSILGISPISLLPVGGIS